jgi:hypothetical protein
VSIEKVDINALATKAVAATESTEGARRWLIKKAQDDPAIAAVLIESGANTVICGVYTQERHRAVVVAANPDRAMNDDGLQAIARVSLQGLMAWPLPGLHKALGECLREELAESLRYCRKMQGTYQVNADFLANVHRLATDEKRPIKKQLTAEQVRSCRERAERAAA